MGKSTTMGILAFSAVIAFGAGQGLASLYLPAGQSVPGVSIPAPEERVRPGAQDREEAPSREDKSDCDDCVIVMNGSTRGQAALNPGETPEGALASAGLLAGSLWGLFVVSRKRGMPRTFIRGVTVT